MKSTVSTIENNNIKNTITFNTVRDRERARQRGLMSDIQKEIEYVCVCYFTEVLNLKYHQ